MNITINFYSKVFLCWASFYAMSAFSMQRSLPLAIGVAYSAATFQNSPGSSPGGSPVPPLVLATKVAEECAHCKSVTDLKKDGCDHLFCSKCLEGQEGKCPLCTKRGTECSICLEFCRKVLIDTLTCEHEFCYPCLAEWLEKNGGKKKGCPLCRAKPELKICAFCGHNIGAKEVHEIIEDQEISWKGDLKPIRRLVHTGDCAAKYRIVQDYDKKNGHSPEKKAKEHKQLLWLKFRMVT